MYTWQFYYDESIDDFGHIQFCSETKNGAIELFVDWCKENNYTIDDYIVEIVYCKEDHEEYGNDYRWE